MSLCRSRDEDVLDPVCADTLLHASFTPTEIQYCFESCCFVFFFLPLSLYLTFFTALSLSVSLFETL